MRGGTDQNVLDCCGSFIPEDACYAAQAVGKMDQVLDPLGAVRKSADDPHDGLRLTDAQKPFEYVSADKLDYNTLHGLMERQYTACAEWKAMQGAEAIKKAADQEAIRASALQAASA